MILDKTGTITFGNRLAAEFDPVNGADYKDLLRAAALTVSTTTPQKGNLP